MKIKVKNPTHMMMLKKVLQQILKSVIQIGNQNKKNFKNFNFPTYKRKMADFLQKKERERKKEEEK